MQCDDFFIKIRTHVDDLEVGTDQFRRSSKEASRKQWWGLLKFKLLIVLILALIIGFLGGNKISCIIRIICNALWLVGIFVMTKRRPSHSTERIIYKDPKDTPDEQQNYIDQQDDFS